MMLAAPPAAAMTYGNPSSGLEPSVYGGGGSPLSSLLEEASLSLVSLGSAALVSATTLEIDDEDGSSKAGAGADTCELSELRPVARVLSKEGVLEQGK